MCRVKAKDAAKHMKMYKKLPQQRIIQPKMPIVLRVRTPGLRGCFRRTFAWAGECCPRSSGKGGIVRSGPRSVTSECPVSCLGTVPRSGRSLYALHRSSLTAQWPGWPGGWRTGRWHGQAGASTAWLRLLREAKPPHSPHFQFYIHTLKTFGKRGSSLAICLFHFYCIYNKKKNQEETEFKLQMTCCLPSSWDPPSKSAPQGGA